MTAFEFSAVPITKIQTALTRLSNTEEESHVDSTQTVLG